MALGAGQRLGRGQKGTGRKRESETHFVVKRGPHLQKRGDTVLTWKPALWTESPALSACRLPSVYSALDLTSSTSEQNQTSLPV